MEFTLCFLTKRTSAPVRDKPWDLKQGSDPQGFGHKVTQSVQEGFQDFASAQALIWSNLRALTCQRSPHKLRRKHMQQCGSEKAAEPHQYLKLGGGGEVAVSSSPRSVSMRHRLRLLKELFEWRFKAASRPSSTPAGQRRRFTFTWKNNRRPFYFFFFFFAPLHLEWLRPGAKLGSSELSALPASERT